MSRGQDDQMRRRQQRLEVTARAQSMSEGRNYAGIGGAPALRSATVMGDVLGVDRIIRHGTDINCVLNPDGDTALTLSILAGQTEVAIWLIEHGADVEKGLTNGRTPLITAAGAGNLAVVTKLLQAGVHVDHPMRNCSTALMYAVAKGFDAVARVLVAAGASMDLHDDEGWGLADYARMSGLDIADLSGEVGVHQRDVGLISSRIQGRYEEIIDYFARHPYGSDSKDVTVLNILPVVDQCLVLERLLLLGYGTTLNLIDKLSSAYFKAGLTDFMSSFLASCCQIGFLDAYLRDYYSNRRNGASTGGYPVSYKESLARLPRYAFPEDELGRLIRDMCMRFAGADILEGIDLATACGREALEDFKTDRRRFLSEFRRTAADRQAQDRAFHGNDSAC